MESKVQMMRAIAGDSVSTDRCKELLREHEGDANAAMNALMDASYTERDSNTQTAEEAQEVRPRMGMLGRVHALLGRVARALRFVLSPVSWLLRALVSFALVRRLLMLPPADDATADAREGVEHERNNGAVGTRSRISAGAEFARFFESTYGAGGPAFRRGGHIEAVSEAQRQRRLLAILLLDESGEYSDQVCRHVLLSPRTQSLLSNGFVTWGASIHRREATRLMQQLRARQSSAPHLIILKPSSSGAADLLAHAESNDVVNIEHVCQLLQLSLNQTEQTQQQELDEAERSRLLRREQDEEYEKALEEDRQREEQNELERQRKEQEELEKKREEERKEREQEERQHAIEQRRQHAISRLSEEPQTAGELSSPSPSRDDISAPSPGGSTDVVTIAVKLPNGERTKRRFRTSDDIGWLYDFVESHEQLDLLHYALVQSYPRKDMPGRDSGSSFADAGIERNAVLIVESRE